MDRDRKTYMGENEMSKNYANGKELIKVRKQANQCIICGISLVSGHGIAVPPYSNTKKGKICKKHNCELNKEEV